MRKTGTFIFALVLLTFSCKKEYKYYGFYIYKTVELEFQSGMSGDFEFVSPVITNSGNIFDSKGTSSENVDSIFLDAVEIADSSFYHFDKLDIIIASDGLDSIMFANDEGVTNSFDNETINLNIADERMDDYVKAYDFQLQTSGILNHTLTYPTKVLLAIRFKVHSTVK